MLAVSGTNTFRNSPVSTPSLQLIDQPLKYLFTFCDILYRHQSLLSEKAFPEWDFKYFSNAMAFCLIFLAHLASEEPLAPKPTAAAGNTNKKNAWYFQAGLRNWKPGRSRVSLLYVIDYYLTFVYDFRIVAFAFLYAVQADPLCLPGILNFFHFPGFLHSIRIASPSMQSYSFR